MEVGMYDTVRHCIAIRALSKGIQNYHNGITDEIENSSIRDPYYTIVLSIYYALEDDDWNKADETFQTLKTFQDAQYAFNIWQRVGNKYKTEDAYLVTLFLLRHGLIKKSKLGSIQVIADHLRNSKEFSVPKWLLKNY